MLALHPFLKCRIKKFRKRCKFKHGRVANCFKVEDWFDSVGAPELLQVLQGDHTFPCSEDLIRSLSVG